MTDATAPPTNPPADPDGRRWAVAVPSLPPGPPLPLGLPAPLLIVVGASLLAAGTFAFAWVSGVTRTGLGTTGTITATATTASLALALLLRVRTHVTGEVAARWAAMGIATGTAFMLLEHATGAVAVPDLGDPSASGPYVAWHIIVPAGAALGLARWSAPVRRVAFGATVAIAAALALPAVTPVPGPARLAAPGVGVLLVVGWAGITAWWLRRGGRRPRWSEAWVGVLLALGTLEVTAALLVGPDPRGLWTVAALRWQAFVFPVAGTVAGVVRVHRALVLRTDELERETAAHLHANELLARRNADLDAYADVLAHDLRAPLQVAIWSLEVVSDDLADSLDPSHRDLLARAASGQKVAAGLVGSLLTLARAREQDLDLRTIELEGLVTEVVEHTPDVCVEQVTVTASRPVVADPTALRQIVQNLIGNAVAYRRPGCDPRVEVRVDGDHRSGWRVSVADDGVGVDPADRQRIFDAFYRADTSSRAPGVGLGLVICQRLVQRHGGEIGVATSHLGGTEFWFTLPPARPRSVDVRDVVTVHPQLV